MGTGTVTPPDDQAKEAVGGGVDDTTAQGGATPGAAETAAQEEEAVDEVTEGEGGQGEGGDDEELLSSEEVEALRDNPQALMKALRRSYTQKTQQLSQARQVLEALQRDPRGTVMEMARRAGLVVSEQPKKPEINALQEALVEQFGEDAATKILPALEQTFDRLLESKVAPIREASERSLATAAVNQSKATLEAFTTKRPDWKKYEPTMTELGRKIQVVPGSMSEMEYLEHLYTLAKARNPAGVARELNDRMLASARNAERPGSGAAPSKISTEPPADATTKDAVRAAFAGIDWTKGGKGR